MEILLLLQPVNNEWTLLSVIDNRLLFSVY